MPQGVTNQIIKDAVLRNHSNLRTISQRSNAYQQLHQKPDEALQSYNMRYASFFHLAYPELKLDNPLSRMHCIHYASSLFGKLGDEMTGRFNQDLPDNLQMAFERATNFEPRIITKQSINNRKIHKVNQIDIGQEHNIEINEAHVRNPNYKGKNYDPNFTQNRLQNNNNTTNSGNTNNSYTKSHYEPPNQCNHTNSGYGHSKSQAKIKEHLAKPRNWVPHKHETLPEIPHDTAFLCSPADVPGDRKVQLQDKDIATDIRQKFEELCDEYGEAFSKNNEDIGRTKLVKMDIDMGDSPPVSSRPYTLPLKHYEWVQREIESLE